VGLDRLTAEGATVTARAEVWLDGQLADTVPIENGGVVYDAGARVVRSCQVTLRGAVPRLPTDPLAPGGSELRLYRGARDYTGEVIESPLGRYAFDRSQIERVGGVVAITGFSYEQLVTNARWERPYVIARGTNVAAAVAAAVRSRLPVALWRDPNLESTEATTPAVVWGEERENDPTADVRALAAADGLAVSFDREGRLVVASVPDPDEVPARWRYLAGQTATYLGGSKDLQGHPYNVVVARGEPEGDTVPVEATAEDTNPQSASYVGRYRKPYFLTSSYIETARQARRAARSQLNQLTGLGEVVSLAVVPHPELDVGQVVEVIDSKMGVDARYVIDRVELPLRPGQAVLTTRRRRL
jgi:hypothetical protein